ncbi:MAG: hypothetical protein U1E62_07895 [Alsobacter sp.]
MQASLTRLRAGRARKAVLAALVVSATGGAAAAQTQQGCWVTRDGDRPFGHNSAAYYDEALTRNWMRAVQLADGAAMAHHAGTYYAEIPAPQLGMINYQYRTLDANGGFEYQDRTCSSISCSQNYGHGQWAGVPQADGSIYIMVKFTDMIRQSACFSWVGRLNGMAFVSPDGFIWRKVR